MVYQGPVEGIRDSGWPARPRTPAEEKSGSRSAAMPVAPPPDGFAPRVARRPPRRDREGQPGGFDGGHRPEGDVEPNIKLGSLVGLLSRLLVAQEVRAATLLLEDMAMSNMAAVEVSCTHAMVTGQISDFRVKHASILGADVDDALQRWCDEENEIRPQDERVSDEVVSRLGRQARLLSRMNPQRIRFGFVHEDHVVRGVRPRSTSSRHLVRAGPQHRSSNSQRGAAPSQDTSNHRLNRIAPSPPTSSRCQSGGGEARAFSQSPVHHPIAEASFLQQDVDENNCGGEPSGAQSPKGPRPQHYHQS